MQINNNNSRISIVIVNWNNYDVLVGCLRSLRKRGYLSICNVVIQDNGSTDGSVGKIRKEFPEVEILENGENVGYAQGNNRGIRHVLETGAGYIFILNPDTRVMKGCIEELVDTLEKNPDIGIVGPTILDADGKIWSQGGYIDQKRYSGGLIGLGEEDKNDLSDSGPDFVKTTTGRQARMTKHSIRSGHIMKDVDYISGTAMMVRREVFEKVGMFHPGYFIYYEDVELCLRARAAGFRVAHVWHARIDHMESSSFGKASPAHEYYMGRNHLLFVERNAPLMIKFREFIRLPKTAWEHWTKGELSALAGIRDYFLRRYGKK